jgi:hypothetical protein
MGAGFSRQARKERQDGLIHLLLQGMEKASARRRKMQGPPSWLALRALGAHALDERGTFLPDHRHIPLYNRPDESMSTVRYS